MQFGHSYYVSAYTYTDAKYHRVNQAHKDHMVLQVTQDQRVTQVLMENLEMMAILVHPEVMVNLEGATTDQESI